MSTRRNFLKMATMAGGSALLMRSLAWPFAQSPTKIRKFVVPLQGLGPTGIPVATPNTTLFPGEDYYQMRFGEFTQMMHPDLPGPTKFWGYADVTNGQLPNHRYLGGVIVAKQNRPVRLKTINQLPATHPLPVDSTILGAELEQNRICVHLHGGLVPWTSDGGPEAWFSPTSVGPSFLNGTGVPGEALYHYPNGQSSRLVWYHDHALGITRLNAYAGIASAYIIRDDVENFLIKSNIIPSNEIPLIIQDKTFVSQDVWTRDTSGVNRANSGIPTSTKRQVIPEDIGTTGRTWDSLHRSLYRTHRPCQNSLPIPASSMAPFTRSCLWSGATIASASSTVRKARFYNLQLYCASARDAGEADLGKRVHG